MFTCALNKMLLCRNSAREMLSKKEHAMHFILQRHSLLPGLINRDEARFWSQGQKVADIDVSNDLP